MREVHQSYYCLSYFRTPPAVETPIVPPSPTATEVSNRAFQEQPEAADSDVVPRTPGVTRQTRALLNRAFCEQPEAADISSNTPQCPTDSENQNVQETVSLVASFQNLGM